MKQRVITAVIAAALFIPIVYIGGTLFLAIIYAMATIGVSELFRMRKMQLFSFAGLVSLVGLWIILLPDSLISDISWLKELDKPGAIYVILTLLLATTVISKNKFTFEDASFSALTFLYVGVSFYYFFQLREIGLDYLLHVMFLIWASDIGAYQFGRKLGKHKLWPTISPNKTIEGFFGGMLSATIVSLCFYFLSDLDYTFIQFVLFGIVIASVGTFGDLVQSAYKRHYGVKDSGNLLPGHGGILDRFDSLMYTVPILFIFGFIGG
ncbi:MAG: phosphatidate cytidylyltransferase [Bacillales bacterium]|jgi:phosphatidate cytidylyltransferase|nr:phosphatidate cytidylyltransferase [Bacillales bacterium]